MPKHPPKAVVDESERRDLWKRLREKPGVKILEIAIKNPSEQ